MKARHRIEKIAEWLDDRFEIPGVGIRIGWDSILGLIPGIGDFLGLAFSSWLILEGFRIGAPMTVLLRMAANLGVDWILGLIPLFGDLADIGWRANRRNARLLETYLATPERVKVRSRILVGFAGAAILATGLFALYLTWSLTMAAVHWLGGITGLTSALLPER